MEDNSLHKKMKIIENDKNIFDINGEYVIPLYQRGYEWEEKEISKLIEDIDGRRINEKYYLGTLIVSTTEVDGKKQHEIIDGQQRLTTLFLMLNCICKNIKKSLKFACRDKSNYTLEHIESIINKKSFENEENKYDKNIVKAINIIKENFKNIDKEEFIKKLSNVVIFQIEVPQHTDLNHYFEIMNTRGEQLSQTDVLKAKLMSYLAKEERVIFANIWDACSEMDTYLQMNFSKDVREQLFGKTWNELPPDNWEELKKLKLTNWENENEFKIDEIIDSNYREKDIEKIEEKDEDEKETYSSIIDFSPFLIHVLKVYILNEKIENEKNINKTIDDIKILETFEKYTKNMEQDKLREFSKKFIIYLMKCRFIFDKYFIKRKHIGDTIGNDKWSLQELNASGRNKTPGYSETKFIEEKDKNKENANAIYNKNILMLQSALRVTYTSSKVMYWITEILQWLVENNCENIKNNLNRFDLEIEDFIKKEVNENFFGTEQADHQGTNTHHIVFNYLDYLLWKEKRVRDSENFVFEFRNSVEHWYPQHPSINTFEKWENEKERDNFGNLCLLQIGDNSKFSNLPPSAKKGFKDTIETGSLKLRLMAEDTIEHGDVNADKYWKTKGYLEHGKEMIDILRKACNKED